MASLLELQNNLKSLLKVLYEEKEILILNDWEGLLRIVKLKDDYIEKLSKFKGIDIEDNIKIMNIIEEINSLQETNLLLTKQALSFQNMLLESISKNLQKMSNTYSPKGNYESKNNISLINQSV